MNADRTTLKGRIESGKPVVTIELSPSRDASTDALKAAATKLKGSVHAIGVSDNRTHIGVSSLAASSIISSFGVEPIMHMVTRDRNRVALLSDVLGARAIGIPNLLVTSGTHQTLGSFRAAKNVFDLDAVQLLKECSGNGTILENGAADNSLCLGATASPFADPAELQLMRLVKKVSVGAMFVITQPIYDTDRFADWWKLVVAKGIHEKTAVIAGIKPLLSAVAAKESASKRPNPRIPEAISKRLLAKSDKAAARAEGIAVAVETIDRLRSLKGIRGFDILSDGDPDAAQEIIDKSGLGNI
jgi:methylenetetrahydrofolate reductase (NADPH)